MKRTYTFTFTDNDVDIENEGSAENALTALKNGDLTFDDLMSSVDGLDYSLQLEITVKDEK